MRTGKRNAVEQRLTILTNRGVDVERGNETGREFPTRVPASTYGVKTVDAGRALMRRGQ